MDDLDIIISSAERSVKEGKSTSASRPSQAAVQKESAFAPPRAQAQKASGWDDWNIDEIAAESPEEKNAKFVTTTILIVVVSLALLALIYFQMNANGPNQRNKKSESFDLVMKGQNTGPKIQFHIAEAGSKYVKAAAVPSNYVRPKRPKIASKPRDGEPPTKSPPKVERKDYIMKNGKKYILVN